MVSKTVSQQRMWWGLLSLSFLSLARAQKTAPICDWSFCDHDSKALDPALEEFVYDVGDGPQTTLVYVEPDLNSFYRTEESDDSKEPPAYSRVKPEFEGLGGKFINLSNRAVDFYWEESEGGEAYIMERYQPFNSDGTGTFPGHRFFFTKADDPTRTKLQLWVIEDYPENIYWYDPYFVDGDPAETERNLKEHLSPGERKRYDKWRKTLLFNEQYKAKTGRSYLANYGDNGPKPRPMHHMWRADYFGQEHWVTTQETHFVSLPPMEELGKITANGSKRILKESDPRSFQEYRARDEASGQLLPYMNMTLKVLSCAPRVFEIQNFLSEQEVTHILQLAGKIQLKKSRTGNSATGSIDSSADTQTRTSENSWVKRERSPIIDAIYRRAADLTRIDEALLRHRSADENDKWGHLPDQSSLAEQLQLVHYDVTQEYTAHHDFGYSHIDDKHQGQRYCTILFYLNDDMIGGETAFPRYVNGKTFHELRVKPEPGKAVLFYDQLPDGNLDDFSQHSAKPIIEGEKWLINLWIWDPTQNQQS